MSRMSELHDDLETIHAILLGQRQQAVLNYQNSGESFYQGTIRCIDDLLLEFEAAGIQWPDNVVEIDHA